MDNIPELYPYLNINITQPRTQIARHGFFHSKEMLSNKNEEVKLWVKSAIHENNDQRKTYLDSWRMLPPHHRQFVLSFNHSEPFVADRYGGPPNDSIECMHV